MYRGARREGVGWTWWVSGGWGVVVGGGMSDVGLWVRSWLLGGRRGDVDGWDGRRRVCRGWGVGMW